MSRRKQAKPRSLKRDEVPDFMEESTTSDVYVCTMNNKNSLDINVQADFFGMEDSVIVEKPHCDPEMSVVTMETENSPESGTPHLHVHPLLSSPAVNSAPFLSRLHYHPPFLCSLNTKRLHPPFSFSAVRHTERAQGTCDRQPPHASTCTCLGQSSVAQRRLLRPSASVGRDCWRRCRAHWSQIPASMHGPLDALSRDSPPSSTASRLMEVIARLNGGIGTPTSWRSSDTPDDQSMSPTSCTTLSDPDADLTYTIGVTESTPYACHFCDKAFPRLSYLKRHEQVHSDQMPFKCNFCQRLFKHKRSRDRHVKLHTGDRKYRCSQCEAAFSRSDHLKIHMKTHDNAKPYQCTVCNRGYNTAAALTSHMQNHKRDSSNPSSPYQNFRCLQCTAAFATAKDLQLHVSTHDDSSSPSEKSLQCTFCPEVLFNSDRHRQHLEQKHPLESQGKCCICKEFFTSIEALLQHKKVHECFPRTKESSSPTPRFACGFCTKGEFPTLDSLQQHMQECHLPLGQGIEPLPTPSLSPSSTPGVPNELSTHLSSNVGTYGCEYCTMKFASVHALQKHTLTVHSFSEVMDGFQENVYCSQCSKTFSSASALTEHVKTKHERELGGGAVPTTPKDPTDKKPQQARTKGSSPRQPSIPDIPVFNGTTPHFPSPGPFLCSQCNAALPDFESFRTHLKSHIDAGIKKFTCSECNGEFSTEEQLDSHVANHYLATTTEYGCQCCLKMFMKPDQLQKHLMDIHAHQLYRCALCKEMFDSKVSIQVHFAVKHSNECHLFKCTTCNAAFRTDVEFQLHVKVAHLAKLQPFRCLLCDMCFPSELQLHLHLHSHKKQFVCSLCDEAFHVEFLLDRHIQEKHSSENVVSMVTSDSEAIQNLSLKPRKKAELDMHFGGNKKQVHCDICNASFSSESSLSVHKRQVHNIRTSGSQKTGQTTLSLFCAYCNESCKSRTELENHMKSHTVSPSKHKCNICDEVCPSAGTLAEHKLTHCKVVTGSSCTSCHVVLKIEDQFYAHLQEHNPQGLPSPCIVCRQTLMSDVEVQVHAKFHLKNNEISYACCVCGRQSSMQQLIITGTQDSHSYMCKDCFHAKGDDLRCMECQVKFESVSELEKHRSSHRKTYQCIKCQMSFESEAEIQIHVTTHVLHEGTNHTCHLCPKVYDSPAKLQCHLIEHTFEGCSSYSCYMCSAVFTAPHLIQQHMLDHGLSSRPYDCGHCHQRFFFRTELENHSFVHRDVLQKPSHFQCPDCNKVFPSITNLNNHRKIHEQKVGSLKCSLCPEVFDTSADMQQHHFRLHSDNDLQEGKKCFPCSECDKVFPCMSNLQGHLRIHTQGTKYTCPECNKEFALSRNLNIHMRSHSGEKPYECPICKKRFARKENRKAHLKSHTGLKPFMCPHCGKTFSRKCHVKEHMRIHITSTTHPCEECTETFSSIRQLRHHLVDAHHKRFDYTCSVCGDVFEHSKSLDHHLSKEHDVRTINHDDSSPMEDISESSLGQSSSSVDAKDLDSSECSSIMEESDTRDSPISVIDDIPEAVQQVSS